jgi:hypothetical protein
MALFEQLRNTIDGSLQIRGRKVSLGKVFLTKFFIFILIFGMANAVFSQAKKDEIISFQGFIKDISKDYTFIVVNSDNVLISSDTKIVNEKGWTLKIEDLKPKLYVVIEAVVVKSKGLLAKKIVIRKPPEV